MKEITKDWLTSADSDLQIIQHIEKEEYLTHQLAFHAQQAVEKSFKAIIEEFELNFIKTHSLETLYNVVKDRLHLELDLEILILLDQMYISARYPGEMGLLPNGKPSLEEAENFKGFAKTVFSLTIDLCK